MAVGGEPTHTWLGIYVLYTESPRAKDLGECFIFFFWNKARKKKKIFYCKFVARHLCYFVMYGGNALNRDLNKYCCMTEQALYFCKVVVNWIECIVEMLCSISLATFLQIAYASRYFRRWAMIILVLEQSFGIWEWVDSIHVGESINVETKFNGLVWI